MDRFTNLEVLSCIVFYFLQSFLVQEFKIQSRVLEKFSRKWWHCLPREAAWLCINLHCVSPYFVSPVFRSKVDRISCETTGMMGIEETIEDETRFVIINDPKNPAPFNNCSCGSKPVLLSESTSSPKKSGASYCQAIDCYDGKMIGCCNQAKLTLLFRSSKRVPYRVFCEVHLARLRRHHCCPGCGIYCTQGEFLQCFAVKKQVHLFHKSCQIVTQHVGPGKQHCPHCGSISEEKSVMITMNGSLNSETIYYLWNNSLAGSPSTKRRLSLMNDSGSSIVNNSVHNDLHEDDVEEPQEVTPRAKMSLIARSPHEDQEDVIEGHGDEADVSSISVTIPSTQKRLSSSGLPVGAVREELETILLSLNESMKRSVESVPVTESLYSLTRANNLEGVVQLLSRGVDPNVKYEENEDETALHAAAAEGNLLILHVLIQSGANVNVINARLSTPLMEAVENDKNDCVDHLVRIGASLDFRGEDGMTALHIASKQGNLQAVKAIIESKRIDINLQDDGGWTPLIWATEHKQKHVVDYLLSMGGDALIQDDEENVCLHWSAFSGDIDILSIFMQSALDINCVNKHGDTALHIASRRDNVEAVNLLCSRQDVDLNILNKGKESPLDCCPNGSSSFLSLKIKHEMVNIVNNRIANGSKITERYLHRDIAKGKERNPIPIMNAVDDDVSPSADFVYVSANCESTGMNIDKSIGSLQACRCLNDCASEDCNCGIISTGYWYDSDGRLKDSFKYHDPPMILECNRACSCWDNCSNRVVQRGIRCRLQVFKTQGKGWGLKTLKFIRKGTFVIEYVGEYITDSEADARDDDSYLFDLDEKISVSFVHRSLTLALLIVFLSLSWITGRNIELYRCSKLWKRSKVHKP